MKRIGNKSSLRAFSEITEINLTEDKDNMLKNLDLKKVSHYLGSLGFLVLFILFCIPFGTETQERNLYLLFFTIDEYDLFTIGGLIYFIIFFANFLLYLALSTLKILKKDTVRTLPLGYVGLVISVINIIATFGLIILYFDISTILLTLIVVQFVGIAVVYVSWIYACKNPDAEVIGLSEHNRYFIYSLMEICLFLLPFIIFICFFLIIINGKGLNVSNKNSKTYTQFKWDKEKNKITVNNETYLVKDNKLFDSETNEEVGHLENNQVIMKIKDK